MIATSDGTRPAAKPRGTTTEGPSRGENVKGGRRDKKTSGYTGQVVIVQCAAAEGSEEHFADDSQGVREQIPRAGVEGPVYAVVKYARIQKNFKAELKRLEMNIVDESQSDEVWQIIKEDLKRDKEVQWYHRKPVKLDCGCLYRLRSGRRAMCWRCMGYPYVAFS